MPGRLERECMFKALAGHRFERGGGILTLRRTYFVAAAVVIAGVSASASAQNAKQVEAYIPEAMPAGVQIVATDVDGFVFANADGHTFYTWPSRGGGGEGAGEQK